MPDVYYFARSEASREIRKRGYNSILNRGLYTIFLLLELEILLFNDFKMILRKILIFVY